MVCTHRVPTLRQYARTHAAAPFYRAGKYTWDEGSKDCPAGSTRIVAAAVCERAAVDSGKTWGGTEDNALFPVGCYWQTSSAYGFLNTNAVGAAYPNARLLCAVGSGARSSRTPMRALKGPPPSAHARRCASGSSNTLNTSRRSVVHCACVLVHARSMECVSSAAPTISAAPTLAPSSAPTTAGMAGAQPPRLRRGRSRGYRSVP